MTAHLFPFHHGHARAGKRALAISLAWLCLTNLALAQPGKSAVCWSADGNQVAVGTSKKGLALYDARTGRLLRKMRASGPAVTKQPVSFDTQISVTDSLNRLVWAGQHLWTGGEDGRIRLWNPNSGRVLQTQGLGEPITCVSSSADGSLVAYCDSFTQEANGSFSCYQIQEGKLRRLPLPDTGEPETPYESVQISPDGHYLALSSFNRVWLTDLRNARTQVLPMAGKRPQGEPRLALSNEWLAVAFDDRLELSKLESATRPFSSLPLAGVEALCFTAQGLLVYQQNQVIQVRDGAIRGRTKFPFRPIAWSPDGTRAAVQTGEQTKILDWRTGRLVQTLK